MNEGPVHDSGFKSWQSVMEHTSHSSATTHIWQISEILKAVEALDPVIKIICQASTVSAPVFGRQNYKIWNSPAKVAVVVSQREKAWLDGLFSLNKQSFQIYHEKMWYGSIIRGESKYRDINQPERARWSSPRNLYLAIFDILGMVKTTTDPQLV
ncbi:hypothetical protein GX50_05009 [[Emmonsia] crescens]|uniref:Uncharacterized protein n=1 Tax=[Emmonsia] crescens TaxID=73230 RepID=A0A2B7ZF55_9EURO|nr:hypothetical protein GX50_05009 [Emmonsia crescens]